MNFDKEPKSRKKKFVGEGGGGAQVEEGGGGGGLRWLRGMNMRETAHIFFIHDTLSRSLLQNCIVS